MKIAISGKMCSGKTTCTELLLKKYPNGKHVSVASRLKELAIELFDMDKRPEFKDRKLLQTLGGSLRNIDTNVWIRSFVRECEKHEIVICDDIRFKNELDYVKKNGFITIRLDVSEELQTDRIKKTYPERYQTHLDNRNHISETDLDHEDFDYHLTSETFDIFISKLFSEEKKDLGKCLKIKH
jgi:adenylate kinase family enzyme